MTDAEQPRRLRKEDVAPERLDKETLYVSSDGGSRGNPGPAGIGGVAFDHTGTVLAEVCEYLGETTNNVAEYYALVRILEESAGLGFKRIEVRVDSELVVKQVRGEYRVKSEALKPYVARVRKLLRPYSSVQVMHIRREKNKECDRLVNQAIDEGVAGYKDPVLEEEQGSLF